MSLFIYRDDDPRLSIDFPANSIMSVKLFNFKNFLRSKRIKSRVSYLNLIFRNIELTSPDTKKVSKGQILDNFCIFITSP